MKFALVVFLGIFACALGGSINYVSEPRPAYQKDIELSPAIDNVIINGQNAARNQFPYQVSLNWASSGSGGSHVCGGSILSSTVILSAAHCIFNFGSYTVVAGILNRGESTAATQSRGVSAIINHPNWPGGNVVNPFDITILRLSWPLTFTTAVQAISLPTQGATFSGQAVLSGWGRTSSSSAVPAPITLQFANKQLLTQAGCANALISILGSTGRFDNTQICTSGAQRVSACSGDSGGPLVQNGVLVGVVSWGITPCGTLNAPSVYTRTSSYINWINNNS